MSQDLIDRLREATRTGKPDGYTMLAVSEWAQAADLIERQAAQIAELQRENGHLQERIKRTDDCWTKAEKECTELREEVKLFKHGHRIASDNCVRLEGMLAELQKDAQRWRELCAAVKEAEANGNASLWGGEQNLYVDVAWQRKGESGMKLELHWTVDNEKRDDLNAAINALLSPVSEHL